MAKSILIIGAGAVGGTIATILKNKSFDPHVVVKYPEQKFRAKGRGFELKGHHGLINEKITAFLPSDLVDEKYDIIMIATKANDLINSANIALPHLNEDSMVVSLQNGICEDDLGKIVGRKRTVGCVTGWGATMHEYGKFEMTSGGEFVIGNIEGNDQERLRELKSILEHIAPVHISQNIYGALYSKLIINSCISSMGCVSGLLLGDMLTSGVSRDIFINIIQEAMVVAEAKGIKVEPYAGKIDFYNFLKKTGLPARIKRQLIIRIIGMKYRRLKSSMLQSAERGRPTEIDWLNGYISAQAKKFKISVPVNNQVIEMIKEIEAGKRQPSRRNLEEIILPDYR